MKFDPFGLKKKGAQPQQQQQSQQQGGEPQVEELAVLLTAEQVFHTRGISSQDLKNWEASCSQGFQQIFRESPVLQLPVVETKATMSYGGVKYKIFRVPTRDIYILYPADGEPKNSPIYGCAAIHFPQGVPAE